MPDAVNRISSGVAWAAAAKWFDVGASTASFVLLAWLIGPEAWGVFGMALVVTVLPETTLGGSLAEGLIQRRDLRPGHAAAARALHLGLAALFLATTVLLAPSFGDWFGRPELVLLIPAVSATFLPMAFAAPSIALLQRRLRFREIALVDAAGTAAATLVGVSAAFLGAGVWSLAAMEVTRRSTRAVMFLVVEGSSPGLRFNRADFNDLIHFNAMTLGSQLLMQLDLAVPRLAIAVAMGPHALGYFNFAWRLLQQASSLVIAPFSAVVLPTIARLRDEREQMHHAIRRIMQASTVAAYPVFLGAIAVAPVAVPLILGSAWTPAAPVIQLMLLLGIRSATNAFSGSIVRGCGKPGLQTANVAMGFLVTCCLVPVAAGFGLEAVVGAMLVKALLMWVSGALLVQRASGYSAIAQIVIGWRSLLAAATMAGFVMIAAHTLEGAMKGWPLLLTLIVGGSIVYPLVLGLLDRRSAGAAMSALVQRATGWRGLRGLRGPTS